MQEKDLFLKVRIRIKVSQPRRANEDTVAGSKAEGTSGFKARTEFARFGQIMDRGLKSSRLLCGFWMRIPSLAGLRALSYAARGERARGGPAKGRGGQQMEGKEERQRSRDFRRSPMPRLEFFATCNPGMENVLAKELLWLGLGEDMIRPSRAGVSFYGDTLEVGMRATLWLRSASRVLTKIVGGPLTGRGDAYDKIYRFVRSADDWPALLAGGKTVGVRSHVNACSEFQSSLLSTLAARNAVLDCVSDSGIGRPPPPDGLPDLLLYCTFHQVCKSSLCAVLFSTV